MGICLNWIEVIVCEIVSNEPADEIMSSATPPDTKLPGDLKDVDAKTTDKTSRNFTPLIIGFFMLIFLITGVVLGAVVFARDGSSANLSNGEKSCRYNEITYKHGYAFDSIDGCNVCGCNNGNVFCTEKACGEEVTPTPSAQTTEQGTVIPTISVKDRDYALDIYGISLVIPSNWEVSYKHDPLGGEIQNTYSFYDENDNLILTIGDTDGGVIDNFCAFGSKSEIEYNIDGTTRIMIKCQDAEGYLGQLLLKDFNVGLYAKADSALVDKVINSIRFNK